MARKRKINIQEVDLLKLMSILLPILLAMSGFIYMQYTEWLEPDFTNSQYYTTAWLDYGVNQNTLNIEYKVDLKGAVFPAIREALIRVDRKSEWNKKIDDKPILVVLYTRDKTVLYEMGRVVITRSDIQIMEAGTQEEKDALINNIKDRAETSYNQNHLMVERNGKIEYVPVNSTTLSPEAAYREYLEEHEAVFSE